VYRMGLARTRRGARQFVNHGHVLVNGKKVDIPSFQVKPGSTIEVKENMRNNRVVLESLEATLNTPAFVTFDKNTMKGTYVRLPERNELNSDFNELLVVEYYNRKK
ncbi:MAG: 30S ribosomal protein S4, partial [Erysipelotrichaceae bacterium]|nr:30S ribosomal protein S4 [Erysipelotrichaceae bacterium]